MRSFQQFLIEQPLQFSRNVSYSGGLNIPDFDDAKQKIPLGGHSNWSQFAQYAIQKRRMEGPYRDLYAWRMSLEKFRNLCNEADAAFRTRQDSTNDPRAKHLQTAYPHIHVDYGPQINGGYPKAVLYGFTESEIIGGYFPRVRMQDLRYAIEHGILQKVMTNDGERYNLIVENLIKSINETKEKLEQIESKDELKLAGAQSFDNLLGKMKQGFLKDSGVPNLANPK